MNKTSVFVMELERGGYHQELLAGPPKTGGMRSGRVCLEPGQECGKHSTGSYEEQLVFLAGKGTAIVDGEQFEVGRGKVAYISPQTEHNIKNTGDGPLEYIYCVCPAHE